MRITRITVHQMELPLSEPYRLSGGRLLVERLDSTFARIDVDAGLSGWGESCPWGHTYIAAHGPGVRAGIATIAPALIGEDPRCLDRINRLMDRQLPGHFEAKSALDIACWDILGQAAGMPVWKLAGGSSDPRVEINSSIPTGAPEEMLALIKRAAARGCRTHSAKIGGDDPQLDVARMDAICAALPEGHSVTFDVNRAWTPGVAVQALNAAAGRGWIEQPCETLGECAHVASRVRNPIMLDECLRSFEDHLEAWRRGACEGVKVKPGRVGGLTRARRIRDFGIEAGWRMHIEDVGGSALADTAAIHLAAATPRRNRLASWLCQEHLAADPLGGRGARNADGFAAPPDAPGLGAAPDPEPLGDPIAAYE